MAKKQFKVNKRFKYKAFFIAASLLSFGYLLFHSYYTYIDNTREEDLPLIRAPINIISKPKDPGGMIVPDKDKDIYKQMSGKKKTNETIMTAELDENNLSKSKALDLINNQLKKWK